MEGEILGGRYEVVRELGRGGMGAVYEARHNGTGRRVAVKVITADLLKAPGLVARFEVEARAAGGIESQHVAQVLDSGTDERHGAPYIVMEYLSGEDLHQVLHRMGPLPPDLALRIIAQACLGLDKAHKSKIIHRDVKPANIYLSERDGDEVVVKLLDFGIAKIKAEEGQSISEVLTRTGSLLGSPLYMSPEQARGDKAIDKRSDLWSLGIVLYEALVGRTPYHEIEALGSLIIAICSEPPTPVQTMAPWVPGDVAAIVHKALALRPESRFQSAGEMYKAIKAILPSGHTIEKSMFVPLTSDERAKHAEPMTTAQTALSSSNPDTSSSQPGLRSSPSIEPPAGRASNPALAASVPGEVAVRSSGIGPSASERPSGPEVRVRTTAGVTSDPRNASMAPPRSKVLLAVGAVVAVTVAAFVAVRATTASPSAQASPAAVLQAPVGVLQATATPVTTGDAPPTVAADAGAAAPLVVPADTASAAASDTAKAKAAGHVAGKLPVPKATPTPPTPPTKNVDGRMIRTDLP